MTCPIPGLPPGKCWCVSAQSESDPWAALVREGRCGLRQPLPLIPGSELSGIVEGVVYGATNEMFTGACVEFALASAAMVGDAAGNVGAYAVQPAVTQACIQSQPQPPPNRSTS